MQQQMWSLTIIWGGWSLKDALPCRGPVEHCRLPGAAKTRLPFVCPLDHVSCWHTLFLCDNRHTCLLIIPPVDGASCWTVVDVARSCRQQRAAAMQAPVASSAGAHQPSGLHGAPVQAK